MEKCNTYTIYMSRTVGSIPGEWCWWLKVWSGSAIAFDSPHLTERKKFPFMEKTIISRQYYFDWKCPSHMSNLRWRFRSKTTILFTPSDAIDLCQPLFSLLLSPADKKTVSFIYFCVCCKFRLPKSIFTIFFFIFSTRVFLELEPLSEFEFTFWFWLAVEAAAVVTSFATFKFEQAILEGGKK